ncbi:unnamed protein product [Paramecium sonneborni]|uniref:Uncharacterized protein n=1 Tax=Paramecium sonneborni TaxID=65129 RepID=A0A8S1RV66_9CILI|nr:unnamed protein product [Paramecium sonneborni]
MSLQYRYQKEGIHFEIIIMLFNTSYQLRAHRYLRLRQLKDRQSEANLLEKNGILLQCYQKRVINLEQQVEQLNEQLAQAVKLQFNKCTTNKVKILLMMKQSLKLIEKFQLEGNSRNELHNISSLILNTGFSKQ